MRLPTVRINKRSRKLEVRRISLTLRIACYVIIARGHRQRNGISFTCSGTAARKPSARFTRPSATTAPAPMWFPRDGPRADAGQLPRRHYPACLRGLRCGPATAPPFSPAASSRSCPCFGCGLSPGCALPRQYCCLSGRRFTGRPSLASTVQRPGHKGTFLLCLDSPPRLPRPLASGLVCSTLLFPPRRWMDSAVLRCKREQGTASGESCK